MSRYVKIFQEAEPAIFRIHAEQIDVVTGFLTNFFKTEVFSDNNHISKLKSQF